MIHLVMANHHLSKKGGESCGSFKKVIALFMQKNIIKQIDMYIHEEEASESIQTMVLAIVSLGVAIALGWWIWNLLKKSTKKEDCNNSDSPFCAG